MNAGLRVNSSILYSVIPNSVDSVNCMTDIAAYYFEQKLLNYYVMLVQAVMS